MAFVRSYLLLITGEAGLALGALLWMRAGSGQASVGAPSWSWTVAAGLLLTCLAACAWLAYLALAKPVWLEAAEAWLERLSRRQGVLFSLLGIVILSALLTTAALAQLAPDPAPDLILDMQAGLAAVLPLILWTGLAAAQLLGLVFILYPQTRRPLIRGSLLGGVLLVGVVLYWRGAVLQLVYVNDDLLSTDQDAYITHTRLLAESGYTYPGDFNRMPIYPFLQSLFYRPGMVDQEIFLQGKYLNLLLSLLLLAILALIISRIFRPLSALNLTLILAFLVFVFRAGFYQAELLFYFFNICLFWCLWRLLYRPSIGVAVLAGLLAGLAHLTKASILPGLVLFLVFGLLQGLRAGVRRGRPAQGQSARAYFLAALLAALVFLATVFPYIQTSKRMTGRYFYNVNSTFYIWYDSWEEAKLGTRAHGDRLGWPDMPAEDIPSMSKYLREHTSEEILFRWAYGTNKVLYRMANSYGYFKYILLYAVLFLVAIAIKRRQALAWSRDHVFLLLFFLAYFGGYLLLYGWYAPIASGNRLVLAQVIPLIIILAYGLQALLENDRVIVWERPINLLTIVNLAILALLIVDIFDVLREGILSEYGGF